MEENKKAPICLLPFYALYYRGDDHKIGSCCMQKPMLSYVSDGDIRKWWTGHDAQKIRKQFLDGEWPDSCKICKKQEESGQESQRQLWTNNFMLDIGASYSDLDVIKGNSTGQPFFVDYRPDNFCNLSCSMCNPGASNQIEKMARDLELDIFKLPTNSSFNENDNIKQIITNETKRIKINGGEPTINNKIKDIYQYAIDNNLAKNMRLQFTTNFTNFNNTFNMLNDFGHVNIAASLDGTGDTYNYIRSPAKWPAVKDNILKFHELYAKNPKKFAFGINCVWFSATAFTVKDWLPEMLDFLDTYFPTRHVYLNQCQTPAFQNLSIIPTEYRDEIYEQIEILKPKYSRHHKIFDQMKFGLDWFEFDPKNLKTWQETNPRMDAYKKVDITTLHPRFKDLMNYNV